MKIVTVLMSTYNGEKFLQEQLNSLYAQIGVHIIVLVRDDGSKDSTHSILNKNKEKNLLDWYTGENMGPARSFMDLVMNTPESDYYAFCDQDDVWLPDKLFVAVNQLEQYSDGRPALYYGHPRLVDADKNLIISSATTYDTFTDFNSCMINSNATGCTMVFNKKMLNIAREGEADYIFMHDSWFHKICIIVRGNLIYDNDVHILYRQHGGNVIGGGTSSSLHKLKRHYHSWKDAECIRSKTINSLIICYGVFMNEKELMKAKKVAYYQNNIYAKLNLLFDKDIKTKYIRRNILFKIAVLLSVF